MKKIFPYLLILVICLSFFYKTFTEGLLPVPTDTLIGMYHPWLDQAAVTNPAGVPFKNFLITDPIRQQIPWKKIVIDDFKRGQIPSWNPYNFSGMSLVSNIQSGVFAPLNIFFFLMSFSRAWTVVIILQTIIAGIFFYVYLSRKYISPEAGVFSALVWAFCGFSIAWLTWGTIVATALWLPLLLLAIDESRVWLFIISAACMFFSGHIQVAMYCFILATLYSVAKKSWMFIVGGIGVAVITYLQWAPMLSFISHSARIADSTAWLKEGWFLPWQNLVQFIAPDFWGNPATLNYTGVWNYGEFIGYIGILPLIFAIFAVIAKHDRRTVFFASIVGVCFLFMLPTPVATLPYRWHIPIFSSLQPTRLMVLVDFSLVMLAAFGVDMFAKKQHKGVFIAAGLVGVGFMWLWVFVLRHPDMLVARRNLMLPTGLYFASVLILAASLYRKAWWRRLIVYLGIIITIVDIFRFGWKFTPFTPKEYFFPSTNSISLLQSQKKPFRIMSTDNRIMPPNVNAYYSIESIEGYDPVYDARYEEYMAALNRGEPNITPPFGFNRIITTSRLDSPLLRLLNVVYVLSLDDINRSDMELMYKEGNTRVYFYKKSLPRIYPVSHVIYRQTKQEIMATLYSKEFNPLQDAVVEVELSVNSLPLDKTDVVKITGYTESSISATTSFKDAHFVVISNMFDPGWKATIDGLPAKMYRTNYLFQGVIVPGGDHTILLRYN